MGVSPTRFLPAAAAAAAAAGAALTLLAAAAAAQSTLPLVGADMSLLPAILDATPIPPYKARNGTALAPADTLDYILAAGAFTTLRLRLFVDPSAEDVSDLPYTLQAARQATAAGAGVMLALHYSDTWADPGRQDIPAAWRAACGTDVDCLAGRLEAYTTATVNAFADAGVNLVAVQLGNEIRNGMLFPTGRLRNLSCGRAGQLGGQLAFEGAPAAFDAIAAYLLAGLRGLRASRGAAARAILHIDRGDCLAITRSALEPLDARGAVAGFDLLGFSYHPKHHDGSLADVETAMAGVVSDYGKDVALVEVGFPFTGGRFENRSSTWDWPVSVAGQAQFVTDLIRVMEAVGRPAEAGVGKGVGIFWWQPELVQGYAIPAWEDGRYSLFDRDARALPALTAFAARQGVPPRGGGPCVGGCVVGPPGGRDNPAVFPR